jgi:copper chaperone NosL
MFLRMKWITCVLCGVILLLASPVLSMAADTAALPDGSKLDLSGLCPVCGMKVGAGTLGPAAVVFKDGKVVPLDGPGDFFRYVLSPSKYKFDPANIKTTFVTEYGTKKFIDPKSAFFVVGSDVTGGMGPEAIPFAKKEDAEKFKAAHHGKSVLGYAEVTLIDLKAKKKMMKMKMKMEHPK